MPAWTTTVRYSAVSFHKPSELKHVSYTNDGVGTNQLDEAVRDRALGVTLSIGLNVAEITDVAGLVGGGTVSLAVGVDCGEMIC